MSDLKFEIPTLSPETLKWLLAPKLLIPEALRTELLALLCKIPEPSESASRLEANLAEALESLLLSFSPGSPILDSRTGAHYYEVVSKLEINNFWCRSPYNGKVSLEWVGLPDKHPVYAAAILCYQAYCAAKKEPVTLKPDIIVDGWRLS